MADSETLHRLRNENLRLWAIVRKLTGVISDLSSLHEPPAEATVALAEIEKEPIVIADDVIPDTPPTVDQADVKPVQVKKPRRRPLTEEEYAALDQKLLKLLEDGPIEAQIGIKLMGVSKVICNKIRARLGIKSTRIHTPPMIFIWHMPEHHINPEDFRELIEERKRAYPAMIKKSKQVNRKYRLSELKRAWSTGSQ